MIFIMRLRVRVPESETETPVNRGFLSRCWDWLQGATPAAAAPPAAPAPEPVLDKRWLTLGEYKYFQRGRTCRFAGCWRSDYWFDVLKGGAIQSVRVTLPERLTGGRDGRVTEAERLRAVMATLEAALASGAEQAEVKALPLQVTPDK